MSIGTKFTKSLMLADASACVFLSVGGSGKNKKQTKQFVISYTAGGEGEQAGKLALPPTNLTQSDLRS